MQGNKKHTDGHSDSSSIGSLLDDTDREVCSLTDRAFKSLCVAELEAAYTEADPALSPSSPHEAACKSYQGPRNHALQRNMAFGKGLSKTHEQSTFQQFPKEKQENQKISTICTPNIRRKLGLPVSSLRSYKHTSKVSSLIKTFDKFENQEPLALAKQPVKNSLAKFPLICEDDMASWGDKTILNIQKELSEFSDSYQDMSNASRKQEIPIYNKTDSVCQGPQSLCPSHSDASNTPKLNIFSVSKRAMKNRSGKGKEQGKKGNFLHSENSAFESWNLHTKKQSGMSGSPDFLPTERAHKYMREAPFLKESCVTEYKPPQHKITAPMILGQDLSDLFPQKSLSQTTVSPVSLAQAHSPPISIDNDAQVLLPQDFVLPASIYRIPTPPLITSKASFPPALISQVVTSPAPISKALIPLLPECMSHGTELQAHMLGDRRLLEKMLKPESKPELENAHPPWRRQKTKGRLELAQDEATEMLKMKDSSLRKLSQAAANDSRISPSDPSSPSFNISKLLTPVILPKTERAPSESHTLLMTPPIAEADTAKESEEKMAYCSQNNYKSKASSLLFNLKDIRKRVKSTYSPSPLLKTLEDKKVKEQDNIKLSVTAANTLMESSKYFEKHDEAHDKFTKQMDSIQQKDRDPNLTGHLAGNYLTLKDHKMASVIEFSPNEENITQHPLPYCSYLANVITEPELDVQNFHLQNPKNIKVIQNHIADVRPQISPNLFLSAEDSIMSNESQVCPPTGNEQSKKARSTSSSEQSFVSVIDHPLNENPFSLMLLFQKACLQESQRNKNEVNEEENPRSKEKEETEKKKLRDSDEKDERQEEPSGNESGGQETATREKRDVGLTSMDSAAEEKTEEPTTPTSPGSLKPNLFTIKDNTFKSSPVIKAVKLPLLRSLSCEDAFPGGHGETEKQIFGPVQSQATSSIQESDMFLLRSTSRQDMKGSENVFGDVLRSFDANELWEDNKGMNAASAISQKELKNREKLFVKSRKKTAGEKLRCNSASGPYFDSGERFAESKQMSDATEETNYFKNHLLPKRRGGACMKKIISHEMSSPNVLEANSPASSEVFQETLSSLASSSLLSLRPDSTMQCNLISPSSDTPATFNAPHAGKVINSSSLSDIIGSEDGPLATEASYSVQPCLPSRHDGSSPMINEKLQLMGRMAKTAAKPPAVPPKTEKALRRAKKLANRKKKTEVQQKRLQEELVSCSGDPANLSVSQSPPSPISLNSSLTPSVSNLVRLHPTPPLSPTHSLPATRRKLLQDPDSGEYILVDLPMQLKTFYDPENGRYVQISVPSSRRNVSQRPTSELFPSSYALYPSTLPMRVSSVPTLASPSQLSESASFVQGAVLESASGWSQSGQYPASLDGHPYVEPAVSDIHAQEVNHAHYNFETDLNLSDNAGIISTGAIEDFAVEGIS